MKRPYKTTYDFERDSGGALTNIDFSIDKRKIISAIIEGDSILIIYIKPNGHAIGVGWPVMQPPEGVDIKDSIVITALDRESKTGRSEIKIVNADKPADEETGDKETSIVKTGTNGDDIFAGGSGNDKLSGKAGNDYISGADGRDVIKGGKGNDIIKGGAGNDLLRGDAGNDELNGGDGNDKLIGGSGADKLSGGLGNDRLLGNAGNDHLLGGDGDDKLNGGRGNDKLQGQRGDDTLVGGKGNDWLDGGRGDDTMTGGQGDDKFYFGTNFVESHNDIVTDFQVGSDKVVISSHIPPYDLFNNERFKLSFADISDEGIGTIKLDILKSDPAPVVGNNQNHSMTLHLDSIISQAALEGMAEDAGGLSNLIFEVV